MSDCCKPKAIDGNSLRRSLNTGDYYLVFECGTRVPIPRDEIEKTRDSKRAFSDFLRRHQYCPKCSHLDLTDDMEAFRIASGGQ